MDTRKLMCVAREMAFEIIIKSNLGTGDEIIEMTLRGPSAMRNDHPVVQAVYSGLVRGIELNCTNVMGIPLSFQFDPNQVGKAIENAIVLLGDPSAVRSVQVDVSPERFEHTFHIMAAEKHLNGKTNYRSTNHRLFSEPDNFAKHFNKNRSYLRGQW